MNTDHVLFGCVRGTVLGLAIFGCWAMVSMLATSAFTPLALPLSVVTGCAFSLARREPPAARVDVGGLPVWAVYACFAVLAAVFSALSYGALVTPSRHWDGFCAWDPRAAFLSAEPSLTQPFFSDPAVFSPARDYPLLQPLCIASLDRLLGPGVGRSLFPLLYLLFVGLVYGAVRRTSARPAFAPIAAVAAGVTPFLVNPNSGAIDSGYGDAFLAVTVAAVVAGVAIRDRTLVVSGIICAVLVKPEGLIYGAIAVAVLWTIADGWLLRAATLGWLGAAALGVPMHMRLSSTGDTPIAVPTVWLTIVVAAIAIVGSDVLLRRRAASPRARVVLVSITFPILGLAIPLLVGSFGGFGGSLGTYLADPSRPLQRIGRLPAIFAGYAEHAFLSLEFGATFLLLLAALIMYRVKRRRLAARGASLFVLAGLAAVIVPFLLSPEEDTRHHVRSSLSRLLLHWLGGAWIIGGVWLDDLLETRVG